MVEKRAAVRKAVGSDVDNAHQARPLPKLQRSRAQPPGTRTSRMPGKAGKFNGHPRIVPSPVSGGPAVALAAASLTKKCHLPLPARERALSRERKATNGFAL